MQLMDFAEIHPIQLAVQVELIHQVYAQVPQVSNVAHLQGVALLVELAPVSEPVNVLEEQVILVIVLVQVMFNVASKELVHRIMVLMCPFSLQLPIGHV